MVGLRRNAMGPMDSDFQVYVSRYINSFGVPVFVLTDYREEGAIYQEFFAFYEDAVNKKGKLYFGRLHFIDFTEEMMSMEEVTFYTRDYVINLLQSDIDKDYLENHDSRLIEKPIEIVCKTPSVLFGIHLRGHCENALSSIFEKTRCKKLKEQLRRIFYLKKPKLISL
jgi:hypothetical protein